MKKIYKKIVFKHGVIAKITNQANVKRSRDAGVWCEEVSDVQN